MTVLKNVKGLVRRAGGVIFGRTPRLHTIPFGPLRGKRICTLFEFSPRAFLGIYDPWLAALARKHIRANNVVYDIGAHIGYTALLFADVLNGSGEVHAFEILPSMVETFLKPTIAANEFQNIFVHAVGLSSREHTIELPVGATGMTSIAARVPDGAQTDVCRVTTLDAYVSEMNLPRPSFIKMDIERAEVECLKGADQVLRNCRPTLVIEFHGVELIEEGFRKLDPLGYSLFTRKGNRIHARHFERMPRFHESVLCLPEP